MKKLLTLLLPCLVLILASCAEKKTEGCIMVKDGNNSNAPIAGATVKITVPGNGQVFYLCSNDPKNNGISEYTETTNAAGLTPKICFAYPAVLPIVVTTSDSRTGTGTLELEQGGSVVAEVIVY